MSYTNYVKDDNGQIVMTVNIICKANPQRTYDEFYDAIKERIEKDGYIPKTSMEHLIGMVVLIFDCDDNYGKYDLETGFGGYGDEFTLEECFRYVEDHEGWKGFDYYC